MRSVFKGHRCGNPSGDNHAQDQVLYPPRGFPDFAFVRVRSRDRPHHRELTPDNLPEGFKSQYVRHGAPAWRTTDSDFVPLEPIERSVWVSRAALP